MKVYVESMGCDSNIADSNRIKTYFKLNKVELTEDYKKADFIILMSCGFNKIMMDDNIKRLKQFAKTNSKIIIGGCIPKINNKITNLADYSFGPKELDKLDRIFNFKTKIKDISPQFDRNDKKIIRIATGCEGNCSYCAIKLANGRTKSRKIDDIKQDIEKGLQEGYQKFIFTAEDAGSWGADIGKNIIELLKEVTKIKGEFKIVLTTVNPKWFIQFPELIELFKSKKIEKKVYFALQSASNKILKLMNREYSVEEYKTIFKKLKNAGIRIECDVLVGFPTETKEDFQKSLKLVKELDISFLQVFVYTDMERTVAYKLKPKVPRNIAEDRAKKIISCFLDKNKHISGRKLVNTNIKIV